MEPAITAAIIGAVSGGISAAVAAAKPSVNDGGMAGSLENESYHEWKFWHASTEHHGQWQITPSTDLSGMEAPQDLYEAWIQSGDVPSGSEPIVKKNPNVDTLPKSTAILLANWIKSNVYTDTTNYDDMYQICNVKGIGHGTSVSYFYHNEAKTTGLGLYLYNPPTGTMTAYASLHSYDWMANWVKKGADDFYEHLDEYAVMNGKDDHSVASQGATATAKSGVYECKFTCAKDPTQFVISQTDY